MRVMEILRHEDSLPHDERIEPVRPWSITADDELLLPIQLQLHPGIAANSRDVARIPALRDHPFQSRPANDRDHPDGSSGK